jgi:uncharacterized membrane protein YtjA (UPF0391 family)
VSGETLPNYAIPASFAPIDALRAAIKPVSSEWGDARNLQRQAHWLLSLYGLEERQMLYWALIFLVVAIIAGVLGFGGIAGAATDIARVLFFVFLVLFIIGLVLGRGVI